MPEDRALRRAINDAILDTRKRGVGRQARAAKQYRKDPEVTRLRVGESGQHNTLPVVPESRYAAHVLAGEVGELPRPDRVVGGVHGRHRHCRRGTRQDDPRRHHHVPAPLFACACCVKGCEKLYWGLDATSLKATTRRFPGVSGAAKVAVIGLADPEFFANWTTSGGGAVDRALAITPIGIMPNHPQQAMYQQQSLLLSWNYLFFWIRLYLRL